jgi:hypothetical protein
MARRRGSTRLESVGSVAFDLFAADSRRAPKVRLLVIAVDWTVAAHAETRVVLARWALEVRVLVMAAPAHLSQVAHRSSASRARSMSIWS